MFISPASFESAWSATSTSTTEKGKIVAGIVNHHAIAPDLIADFFRRLSKNRPDATHLILLSPDHSSTDLPGATIIRTPYQTPDGETSGDDERIEKLLLTRLFINDDRLIGLREHGIGVLMPFIQRAYDGKIRILPLVISQKATDGGLQALANALEPFWDDRTVVILSADLSHGLSKMNAKDRDSETLRWLYERDVISTRSATDDHLDSGANAAILFMMMDEKWISPRFNTFSHCNSTDYGGDARNVTSYVTGAWSTQ